MSHRTRHTTRALSAVAATTVAALLATGAGPVSAHEHRHRGPDAIALPGDPEGSKFEGIGVSPDQRTFYVSETTGGEIHRGDTRGHRAHEWLPAGADGRTTARGITTDAAGRVYIAGGPNGIGTDRPDLWVYSASGRLLAALRTGAENVFLNDVAIGPDGAAYFTDSNTPRIFRVAADRQGDFRVSEWVDASDSIATAEGFNLGGIVLGQDRRHLVVAQGNLGKLWRFDLRDRSVREITADADLRNADGLVRQGNRLLVVRNFDRMLTTLRLDPHGRAARVQSERATDPDRVFTTAKTARGRLLLVDSKFDEDPAQPPYEVVAQPLGRR